MTSREVSEAIGAEGESLDARRERLRQVVATPSERDLAARELLEVEIEIADRNRAALLADVARRVLALKQGIGSLIAESTADERRLLEAARKFVQQGAVLNERYEKIALWRHELHSLIEVFELSAAVPDVVSPAQRPEVIEA